MKRIKLDTNQIILISKLEQNLRQTRALQNRFIQERADLKRLSNEVTPEQERITTEIETLEIAAKQIEVEIFDLLSVLREKNKR
jgi:hypothetical protein